jgi:hypothetical protein
LGAGRARTRLRTRRAVPLVSRGGSRATDVPGESCDEAGRRRDREPRGGEDVRRHARAAGAAAGLRGRRDVDRPVQDGERPRLRSLEHVPILGRVWSCESEFAEEVGDAWP